MTLRVRPFHAALALLVVAVAATAATGSLPFRQNETAAACSSCDARHQNIARKQSATTQESAP